MGLRDVYRTGAMVSTALVAAAATGGGGGVHIGNIVMSPFGGRGTWGSITAMPKGSAVVVGEGARERSVTGSMAFAGALRLAHT